MVTKIFAHRGASKLAPENTMPAFELAYQLGADGIETDVHLTKDHIPILMHDEQVNRTTNGKGYLKDLTLQQLKQLDAGSWFSKDYRGTGIITLAEFLHWIKSKQLCLNIELKNNKVHYKHIEFIVCEMIQSFQLQNRTIISTFNPESIQKMNRMQPGIEIALLTSKQRNNLARYAKELGANAIHIKYRLLHKKLVKQCEEENIKYRPYTINCSRRIKKCLHLACHGIFSDVPNKARIIRDQYI